MQDVSIGAVIHNNTLTLAVRRGAVLDDPIREPITGAEDAIAIILYHCAQHRHDNPAVRIECGPLADMVCVGVRDKCEHPVHIEIVDGLGAALPRFANRRSELHYQFRLLVEEGKLRVPQAYHEQLGAFEEQEKGGKVLISSPLEVATKLGQYPARAVAAVLSSIPALGGGVGKGESEWDPYEAQRA